MAIERASTESKDEGRVAELGQHLGRLLLGDWSWLEGVELLVISPDLDLYGLPFALLRDPAGESLLDRTAIVLSPSIRRFQEQTETLLPLAAGSAVLAVGDPAFDDSVFRLPRLPFAAREASLIADLYPNPASQKLLAEAATYGRVLAGLASVDVAHLALHSLPNRMDPLASFLLLASGGVGNLKALDIARQDLSSIRLVVLSGCSTSDTFEAQTETLSGLTRSFLMAGAPSVVGSLWRVDDVATATVMVDFHRRFSAGASAAEALRQAQRSMRDDQGMSLDHWAAFQVYGASALF